MKKLRLILIQAAIGLVTISTAARAELIIGLPVERAQSFGTISSSDQTEYSQSKPFLEGQECPNPPIPSDSEPAPWRDNLFPLDHDPVASVPEPSTWAMMLLGFVGIGAMTYRRRTRAAIAA
jgi:hypothetical protein